MKTPIFYNKVEKIAIIDPLAKLLGAIDDGIIEYSYFDCVKLAGHSCPTVASSYLMIREGLKKLYQEEMPIRGNIKVSLRDEKSSGVTGVIANVTSYITGACDDSGFKGINGKFQRANLLHYADEYTKGTLKLKRIDTKAIITADFDLTHLKMEPELQKLFADIQSGSTTPDTLQRFGLIWQDRVCDLLTNYNQYIDIH